VKFINHSFNLDCYLTEQPYLSVLKWIPEMALKNILVLTFLFASLSALAQNRQPAFEMNARLGRGINMGNSFEAPTETEWGNQWKPEYFKIISQLGFKHVRLPVRWEPVERSLASAPYTLTPAFLDRIQQVVDTALKYNLHIIVNMHHHEALYENPSAQKERFLSQWSQIADRFKNYPDKLLFEVLNEPHGNITPEIWNEYFAAALVEIRKTNPNRIVLLGVADYGGLGSIGKLDLPEDEYIILSPHYYNPFNFTHQGAEWVDGADAWMGTKWNDTEVDRETIASEFSFAQQFSAANHIPIHVGEFGAYSKADIESRERWTTFLARWF
jgi:endoglucanase